MAAIVDEFAPPVAKKALLIYGCLKVGEIWRDLEESHRMWAWLVAGLMNPKRE